MFLHKYFWKKCWSVCSFFVNQNFIKTIYSRKNVQEQFTKNQGRSRTLIFKIDHRKLTYLRRFWITMSSIISYASVWFVQYINYKARRVAEWVGEQMSLLWRHMVHGVSQHSCISIFNLPTSLLPHNVCYMPLKWQRFYKMLLGA